MKSPVEPQPSSMSLLERRQAVRAARVAACAGDQQVAALVALVAASHQVPQHKILGSGRCDSRVAAARQLAMYLAHVMLSRSQMQIGRLFDRDRTTVCHACWVIEDRRDDPQFDSDVCEIEDVIRGWHEPAASGEAHRAAS
jgi:chromosomal replication initiation ATPase DnaA